MNMVSRVIAISRYFVLKRQYREVVKAMRELTPMHRRALATLTVREWQTASKQPFPYLYGSKKEDLYKPWGSGTATGISKMRSENAQIKLRGMALWLAVAYHETATAPYAELQQLHRDMMKVLRELRGLVPATESRGSQALNAA